MAWPGVYGTGVSMAHTYAFLLLFGLFDLVRREWCWVFSIRIPYLNHDFPYHVALWD